MMRFETTVRDFCPDQIFDCGQCFRWSREPDGSFNEDYCQWCYTRGKFVYTSLEDLTDFLVARMSGENWPPEQARAYFEAQLPKLKYWRQQQA